MASSDNATPSQPAVRFSSVEQVISPDPTLQNVDSSSAQQPISPEAQEELRSISRSIQNTNLQAKRFECFAFEPVSLPVSRVPSPATLAIRSSNPPSSKSSPRISAVHSPPLTPADTQNADNKTPIEPSASQKRPSTDPAMMTPQISPPHEPPPTSINEAPSEKKWQSSGRENSPGESPHPSPRTADISDMSGVIPVHPKQSPNYIIGPMGDSLPVSRQESPSGSPGPATPGTSTPAYSRPMTPAGDPDDPYARSKRPPQNRNLDAIDARFIFSGRDSRKGSRHSATSTAVGLPRSNASESRQQDKRHSFFGGGSAKHEQAAPPLVDTSAAIGKSHGSMSDLKRFFKLGAKHNKEKRTQSPSPSIKSNKSGTRTPPVNAPPSVPFADDHGLQSKYGKFGKVLGSGAGGSVRLMKRSSDGVTFAVKQFRPRHTYEGEKEYNKKVTAEFCVGSTLHHGNIIETMDLVQEKGSWYVVMEYAPFDLFAIVMTGKMSREEVSCATLQILSGVTYLHSMGLAHRDLKLDNVVVNEHGIMKIIDFGSAVVFRYPFEKDVVLASGIVGSDPYLAPEVYDLSKYDPQPTDIWSLAIIFCCMTLRRFPWKAPRLSDNSYKLFVSAPNDGPRRHSDNPSKSLTDLSDHAQDARKHAVSPSEPASRQPSDSSKPADGHHHHHHHRAEVSENGPTNTASSASNGKDATPQQVIKGPWRLLRLLPRESRHIIGRMLEVDPSKRATMQDIIADKWVSTAAVCRQENTSIIRAEGHEHTLEPGSAAPPSPATKKP